MARSTWIVIAVLVALSSLAGFLSSAVRGHGAVALVDGAGTGIVNGLILVVVCLIGAAIRKAIVKP